MASEIKVDQITTLTGNGEITVPVNLTASGLKANNTFTLPQWTDATKPAGSLGLMGWNTDTLSLEFYNGVDWVVLSKIQNIPDLPSATGTGVGVYIGYNTSNTDKWFITYSASDTDMVSQFSSVDVDAAIRIGDSNASFTLPELPSGTTIEMWGAGGGGDRADYWSGSGGYAKAVLSQNLPETAFFVVGQGGANSYGHTSASYTFAAGAGYTVGGGLGAASYGKGGGCSGIFTVDPLVNRTVAGTYMVAGGAGGGIGGGSYTVGGGDGGGSVGYNGTGNSSGGPGTGGGQTGNTTVADGTFFYASYEGSSSCCSGAGGGYIAGKTGAGGCGGVYGGAGGGNGYINTTSFTNDVLDSAGRVGNTQKLTAFTADSPNYVAPTGEPHNGGTTFRSSGSSGGHGLIVVDFTSL
jgi:hypothetical protein